jgi:carboxyl-terminal processing protease
MVGGIILAALGAASFRFGDSLGPDRLSGKNLYIPHAEYAQTASKNPTLLVGLPSVAFRGGHTAVRQETGADNIQDIVTDGPGETFEEVYQKLHQYYVEGIPSDTVLAHGAGQAMLASLGDPQSRFVDAAEMKEIQSEITGTYHGLGAVTEVKTLKHGDPASKTDPGYTEYRLTVVAPISGSPAEKAGLKTGDVITEIDGKWIATYDPVAAAAKQLKGVQDDPVSFNKLAAQIQKQVENAISLSDGENKLNQSSQTPMTLTVERAGEAKPLKVTVDLSPTTSVTPVVAHSLPGGVGYIRINQFVDGADKDFNTALSNFGNDVKGLVIDLRDSPGGQLSVAKAIAEKLSAQPVLAIEQKKGKTETKIALSSSRQIVCPVAVLVNGGTASTSELLASALHDGGAKLVGQQTFGDATDVVPVVLKDGSGFTMAVGQFFTASHASLTGGLKPDIAIPDSAGPDEYLNQAIGTLSGRVAVVPTNRG